MITGTERTLTIVAAIGAGVVAGLFFAFSAVVMRALDRIPASESVSAMNAINKAAPGPPLMTAMFGTAALCVALAVVALRRMDEPWAIYLLIGSAVYLVGVVLTIVYHVPRNDALALVDPHGTEAARAWADYSPGWTAWNHVRMLTSLVGAASFVLALRVG